MITGPALALALLLAAAPAPPARDGVDLDMLTRIRQEGFERSQAMETLSYLCDVIGPRLTGSPGMAEASEWTRRRLESWGLANAHLEPWGPFGRAWSFERAEVRMLQPVAAPLVALPQAWTPGTGGPVRGRAVRIEVASEADLARYKGTLAGAVVFLSGAREVKPEDKPAFTRLTDQDLERLSRYEIPAAQPLDPEAFRKRRALRQALARFLVEERALATIEPSPRGQGGAVVVGWGGSWRLGEPAPVPGLVMAVEHYNRIVRLLERGIGVELELDVRASLGDEAVMASNTVAEIPGSDPGGEVVMLGAHLDSWHAGTGATDDGAGVAAAMEAVRILRAVGAKPRRTIRIALWSGEEQGELGSQAYVKQHFATRPEPADPKQRELPEFLRRPTGPLTLKPEHAKLSVYFNLDSGTGRIRGIYLEGNAGARPVLEDWLAPLADLGAATISLRHDDGTDHESFDAVGLPGFDFMQDPDDYDTLTHHSNLDVLDHVQREDLMQASVVMAAVAYSAAMRPEPFPRKPLPPAP